MHIKKCQNASNLIKFSAVCIPAPYEVPKQQTCVKCSHSASNQICITAYMSFAFAHASLMLSWLCTATTMYLPLMLYMYVSLFPKTLRFSFILMVGVLNTTTGVPRVLLSSTPLDGASHMTGSCRPLSVSYPCNYNS